MSERSTEGPSPTTPEQPTVRHRANAGIDGGDCSVPAQVTAAQSRRRHCEVTFAPALKEPQPHPRGTLARQGTRGRRDRLVGIPPVVPRPPRTRRLSTGSATTPSAPRPPTTLRQYVTDPTQPESATDQAEDEVAVERRSRNYETVFSAPRATLQSPTSRKRPACSDSTVRSAP